MKRPTAMRFFCLFTLLLFLYPLSAQRFLQMETLGRAEVTKYAIGDELTYRLNGSKEWHTGIIGRIQPEENRLLIGIDYLSPDSIQAIRSFHPQQWSRPISTSLATFGLSWSGFALGAWVADRDDPFSSGDFIVSATSIGTGLLIRQLFKHRTYKIGKKRRLRIVDITVYPSK